MRRTRLAIAAVIVLTGIVTTDGLNLSHFDTCFPYRLPIIHLTTFDNLFIVIRYM